MLLGGSSSLFDIGIVLLKLCQRSRMLFYLLRSCFDVRLCLAVLFLELLVLRSEFSMSGLGLLQTGLGFVFAVFRLGELSFESCKGGFGRLCLGFELFVLGLQLCMLALICSRLALTFASRSVASVSLVSNVVNEDWLVFAFSSNSLICFASLSLSAEELLRLSSFVLRSASKVEILLLASDTCLLSVSIWLALLGSASFFSRSAIVLSRLLSVLRCSSACARRSWDSRSNVDFVFSSCCTFLASEALFVSASLTLPSSSFSLAAVSLASCVALSLAVCVSFNLVSSAKHGLRPSCDLLGVGRLLASVTLLHLRPLSSLFPIR